MPLTGIAQQAENATVAYDPSGQPRIAWTATASPEVFSGQLLAAVGEAGDPDPLTLPPPRLQLSGARVGRGDRPTVLVSVDRPCEVMLQTIVAGHVEEPARSFGVGHRFTSAGRVRLAGFPLTYGVERHKHLTLVVYAGSPTGAAAAAAITVPVPRRDRIPDRPKREPRIFAHAPN